MAAGAPAPARVVPRDGLLGGAAGSSERSLGTRRQAGAAHRDYTLSPLGTLENRYFLPVHRRDRAPARLAGDGPVAAQPEPPPPRLSLDARCEPRLVLNFPVAVFKD